MIRRLTLFTAVLLVVYTRVASAFQETSVDPTRFEHSSDTFNSCNIYDVHWDNGVGALDVPVYINTSLANGVQLLKDDSSNFWTSARVASQVQSALAEFNANIPANIKLYYAGPTGSITKSGAIVVSTDTTLTDHLADTSVDSYCVVGSRGKILSARIVAHRYNAQGSERHWTGYDPATGVFLGAQDIWILFTHEMGHALGLAHEGQQSCPCSVVVDSGGTPYAPDYRAVMNGGAVDNLRHWTKYEKDTFQELYGPRGGQIIFWQAGGARRNYGTGGWNQSQPSPPAATVGVGVGTMTQLANGIYYSWADPIDQTVKGRKRTSGSVFTDFHGSNKVLMPAALAHGGTGEYRAYYIEKDPEHVLANGNLQPYGVGFVDKKIRWMSSPDGTSWTEQGYLVDPSNGAAITTWTDNVTAGYDPYRKVFIVLWIDNGYSVRMMTMPGSGSLQAGNTYSLVKYPNLISTLRCWEAPQVSCTGATGTSCMIVGQEWVEGGYLITSQGSVTSTGTWSATASASDSNQPVSESPSVSYQPWNGLFTLVYLGRDGFDINVAHSNIGSNWPMAGIFAGYSTTVTLSSPQIGNDSGCLGCPHHTVIAYTVYGL